MSNSVGVIIIKMLLHLSYVTLVITAAALASPLSLSLPPPIYYAS